MPADPLDLCQQLVAHGAVEGLQVACVRGDHAPTAACFGVATLDSRFALASLSKPIVAAACLVAWEEGVLELDAPLSEHLSEIDEGLTLRDVLSHASGLPADDASARRVQLDPNASWNGVAAAYREVKPVVLPRTQRIYSNAGYALAADALEQATGMDYRTYITESVLIPLGMQQTTFGVGVDDDANVLSVKEPGLLGNDQQLFNGTRFRELGLPQSGAFGTASDYLQLLQMTLRQGRLSSDRHLLAPETASLLSTNQGGSLPGGVGDFMEWECCDWGAGFELRADKSPHWTGTALSAAAFTHFGASGTLAFADPATGTAAVILANRGTYTRWMLEPGGWPDICAALVA